MSRHFLHLGELKTLLETKKVANDGILVLDKYRDKSEVSIVYSHVLCVCVQERGEQAYACQVVSSL